MMVMLAQLKPRLLLIIPNSGILWNKWHILLHLIFYVLNIFTFFFFPQKILNCFGLCLQNFLLHSSRNTIYWRYSKSYIQDIPVTAFYGCPLKTFSCKKTLKSRGALFCGVTSRFKSVENGREWHWKRGKETYILFPPINTQKWQ